MISAYCQPDSVSKFVNMQLRIRCAGKGKNGKIYFYIRIRNRRTSGQNLWCSIWCSPGCMYGRGSDEPCSMWDSYLYRICTDHRRNHDKGTCGLSENRTWYDPWDRLRQLRQRIWCWHLCGTGCAGSAVSWYCAGCWQGTWSKREQDDRWTAGSNRCRRSGYDVRLCNKWDRGIYALCHFTCTQADQETDRSS